MGARPSAFRSPLRGLGASHNAQAHRPGTGHSSCATNPSRLRSFSRPRENTVSAENSDSDSDAFPLWFTLASLSWLIHLDGSAAPVCNTPRAGRRSSAVTSCTTPLRRVAPFQSNLSSCELGFLELSSQKCIPCSKPCSKGSNLWESLRTISIDA